ncbi:hypothetical protein F4225_07885 [Candidatus Poribacteria bacterium]|nr:hypothetical protein [Candidatus Poribacteria bacterium]
MKLVLTLQGSITPNALVKEAAKLLGYKSTSKAVIQQLKPLLDRFIQTRTFQLAANGMIALLEDIS